ncbi:lopap [Leptopilina boulardi]|uniref:lopap n=1 Tax=Leptopilina boulardi TaxID=63433 RepID=UPI0021F5F1BC|nr:lopap [Leptopilina boulardi]
MTSGIKCLNIFISVILIIIINFATNTKGSYWDSEEDNSQCPKVKAIRDFDVSEFLGIWYVVEYYASSEEALAYRCMKAELSVSSENDEVTMNFTYSFVDDPINEQLIGNITWKIPSPDLPAHWVHAEEPYEGVYNTYVLDTDYKSWALLMHCAEKSKSPRYLSSFIMSREVSVGVNVISYLKEKLLRYDVNMEYLFPMEQNNCTTIETQADLMVPPMEPTRQKIGIRKHPLKRKHK